MPETRVLIIGNGIAGFSAAATFRQITPHGLVTMVAMEETPLYSACVLPDYVSGRISRQDTFVKTPKDYEALGIQTCFGSVVREVDRLNKKVFLEDGRVLPFDKLVLATGSEPVAPRPFKKGVFTVKTLGDAEDLRVHQGRRAVIVGSGAIGIETAIALHQTGYEVVLLEMLDHLLPQGLDPSLSKRVTAILEKGGITVLLGEKAEKILGGERVEGLLTDKRTLTCDTLIWAVGMRPRAELAEAAGLALGEKGGIWVDQRLRTSCPDIYACGDCAETPDLLTGEPSLNLFWHNANQQGRVAGRNCSEIPEIYPGSQTILNVDVFGRQVVGFGHTETSLRRAAAMGDGCDETRDISVIEHEKNGGFYRLVMKGNRCFGGQFVNMDKDLGLLWSLMVQKRDLKKWMALFQDGEWVQRRGWLNRIRPYFH